MFKRKISAILMSGIVSLSLAVGICFPLTNLEVADAKAQSPYIGDPQTGLVAHWNFDDNYNEEASGLTTQLGAKQLTYVDGVYGKAAVFNGKDTYLYVQDEILNLGNSKEEDNNNFTISAWINLGDSKNTYKYLLDKGEDIEWGHNDDYLWTNPYTVYFDGTQPIAELSNVIYDPESGIQTEGTNHTGGKYVQGNEWFLLTVTYDGNRVKIYHNNVLLSQSNYPNGITYNKDELYIGVDGKLQYYFKGAVDDLRIYSRPLSYDEVTQIYDLGVTANKELIEPTKGLVAYYPFDDNLKDSSSFKNDAEKVAASGSIKYTVGMNGKAITMSKGSYILVPAADQLNLKDEFTISFFMKNSLEGQFPILYRQNPAYTDDNDNEWTYSLYLNAWQKGEYTSVNMYTNRYNSDNWSQETGQSLGTEFSYEENKIKNTSWNHYTYTYKNGQMKGYINGVLQNKSDESDLVTIENATGDLLIGYDGETFFTGAIDELKIYTSCASADDVEKEAKRIDSISLASADTNNLAKIAKGSSYQIAAVMLKDGDTEKTSTLNTDNKDITYKSSNTKIFTVSKEGKVSGVKAGKAKLTVTYGPHSAVYNVVVK